MDFLDMDNQRIFLKSSEDMSEIQENSIDSIITSPPYNVGKKYGDTYNDKKPIDEYFSMLRKVFSECYRVASERCIFFLNIGDSADSQGKSEMVAKIVEDVGFKRIQTIIWVKSIFGKGHYTPSGGGRRLNNVWEYIFMFSKTNSYSINPKNIGIPYTDKTNIMRFTGEDIRDAGDVWFIPYKTTGATIKKGHAAPFPTNLPLRCLRLLNNPRNVLDPFVGTGSTLRAAKEVGIFGYGYELFPLIDVIQEKLNEPICEDPYPMIPQMETYIDFTSKFIGYLIECTSAETIMKILDKFSVNEKRKFLWSCDDLGKKVIDFDI